MNDNESGGEIEVFFEDTRSITEKLNAEKKDWIPSKNANDPKLIGGLVLERGTYIGGFDDEPCPTARIYSRADNIEWSVIGFHGYLRRILEVKDPRVGDFCALMYGGTKPPKKKGESPACVYSDAIERNPNRPEPRAPASAAAEPKDATAPDDDDGIPF